jgi:DNA-binding Lrp family transcriptional regulator
LLRLEGKIRFVAAKSQTRATLMSDRPFGGARPGQPDPPSGATAAPQGERPDRYDIAILHELQQDARLSNAELSPRVRLSPAPTRRRVKWLEAQRYITGDRAELDRRKLRLGVLALVRVDAARSAGNATRELEDAIRRLPEVISCHCISGAGTVEPQVIVTDLEAFSQFSIKTLLNLPNVDDIRTSFLLGEVKSGAALPLSRL